MAIKILTWLCALLLISCGDEPSTRRRLADAKSVAIDLSVSASLLGQTVSIEVSGGFHPNEGCDFEEGLVVEVNGRPARELSLGDGGPRGCEPALFRYDWSEPRGDPWTRSAPGYIWDRVIVRDASMEASVDAFEIASRTLWFVDVPIEFRPGEKTSAWIEPSGMIDFKRQQFEILFLRNGLAEDGYAAGDFDVKEIVHGEGLLEQNVSFRIPATVPPGMTGYFFIAVPEFDVPIRDCRGAVCSAKMTVRMSDGVKRTVLP